MTDETLKKATEFARHRDMCRAAVGETIIGVTITRKSMLDEGKTLVLPITTCRKIHDLIIEEAKMYQEEISKL